MACSFEMLYRWFHHDKITMSDVNVEFRRHWHYEQEIIVKVYILATFILPGQKITAVWIT